MKIFIASDHAGYEHKKALITFLRDELKHDVEDCGAYVLDPEDDYNSYILKAAQGVAADRESRGIILGGSGQGEAMQANRIAGVRAAVFYGGAMDIVRLAREHNDANILSIGARFVDVDRAKEAIKVWFETKANDAEKYRRRVLSMDNQGLCD